ncbi:LacI family DNA-binding transcriptional regulator [Tenacibaculum sp. IB213877]|uniref:LacI family DNA-binding transcriptional regulator n=1 Tax=Tenacibaculum sp. IB213877 TaxID=3097351 RepID=UPI002A59B705|nr:LacI family DNA-binding transcriptional regulator [Tenacibaculum sp. IB213877]MDY0779511.1 LacI family DNA-binding transcriptional regulator [Tenacibaculum sp. IB213877]
MVTLKDLAKELNVSVSTVSKALSDSHEISKETKQKILTLAQEKQYTPNNIAINLRRKETKTLGVIIPNIFNHFYTKILYGIESEARKNGYKTIISISNETFIAEKEGLSYFSNGCVDGVLMAPSEESEMLNQTKHILELRKKEIPFVFFDRYFDGLDVDKVVIDDYDAAKNAIEYFTNSGKKNILVVSMLKNLWIGKLRREGALTAEGIDIIESESEEEIEFQLNRKLLTQNVDAILALDELSGIISLNLVRTLTFEVPKDVSIISFSQGILSEYSHPKLSTVNQHAQLIGANAVKLLLRRLKNRNPDPVTNVVKSTLEIHGT